MNTNTDYKFLTENGYGGLLLFACYFFIWLALRIAPVLTNTMHFDDFNLFLIINHPTDTIDRTAVCPIPPPDYRWIGYQIGCLLIKTFPDLPISVVPKLTAGLFLSAFAILFFKLLTKWSIPLFVALLIPLVVISHPIANEITLWNSTFTFSLWISLCLGGFMLVDLSNPRWQRLLGVLLLMVVVLSYEIYFILFLVLLAAEPVINRLCNKPMSWASTMSKLSIFIGLSGFYISQVILTKLIFGSVGGRGFVNITTFSAYMNEKIHGIFNLIVNCYMSVLAYYTGIVNAWSGWKYIPVTIALTTLIAAVYSRRKWHDSVLFFVFSLLLPVLPTLPIFVMSQSPESWRVSIPVLVAISLSLVPAATLIWDKGGNAGANRQAKATASRYLVAIVLLAIIGLQIPVTVAEAKLRVAENKLDASLMEIVKNYWQARGVAKDEFRVGVIGSLGLPTEQLAIYDTAQRITVSYHPRGLASGLCCDFSWRGFLTYHGLRVVELDDLRHDEKLQPKIKQGCNTHPELCRLDLKGRLAIQCKNAPDYEQPGTGWRIVHDPDERITVLCH